MRFLTPETDVVIGLFHRTHMLMPLGFGGAHWQLMWLPAEGSIGTQDAWLMSALDHLRHVYNGIAREVMNAATAEGQTHAERE